MRRCGIILMFFALVLSALPGVADQTVQLTLTGLGVGNNSGGVYTFPYDFTVGGTTGVQLMCDTFQNEIYQNESWTANVTSILSAGTSGLFKGTTPSSISSQQILYDEAGLVYLGALGLGPLASLTGTQDSGLANWAVWQLFDPESSASDPYASSTALGNLLSAAATDAANPNDLALLANVVVYTPTGAAPTGPGAPYGQPQEFIGTVPEPGIVGLLVFGLTSLWAFRRKIAL